MASAHESAEAPAVVDAVAPSTTAPVPDMPEEVSPPRKRDIDLEAGMNEPAPPLQRGMELGQSSKSYDDDDDDEDGHDKCRVCHLAFDSKPGSSETMQLGCHCKEDLANAHRDCAEAWFKFKGNRICEICGATAQNILGNENADFMEQWNDTDPNSSSDSHTKCWQSLSLCNFFLACMVVTFVLLWLFHVTVS